MRVRVRMRVNHLLWEEHHEGSCKLCECFTLVGWEQMLIRPLSIQYTKSAAHELRDAPHQY